jgi:hypothetical protein
MNTHGDYNLFVSQAGFPGSEPEVERNYPALRFGAPYLGY